MHAPKQMYEAQIAIATVWLTLQVLFGLYCDLSFIRQRRAALTSRQFLPRDDMQARPMPSRGVRPSVCVPVCK